MDYKALLTEFVEANDNFMALLTDKAQRMTVEERKSGFGVGDYDEALTEARQRYGKAWLAVRTAATHGRGVLDHDEA